MTHPAHGGRTWLAVGLLILALAAPAAAQEEPAPPAEAAAEAPAAEAAEPAAEGSVMVYERGTFRDPFRSLEERKQEDDRPRPPGPAGMLIEEIDLVGLLSGPKGAMVLIIGSDGLGYSLTSGAELYDGRLLRIDEAEGMVVFRQTVDDPNRIKPYRDVERRLNTGS